MHTDWEGTGQEESMVTWESTIQPGILMLSMEKRIVKHLIQIQESILAHR